MKHEHIIDHESYEQLVNAPVNELRVHLKKEIERLSTAIFAGDNVVRDYYQNAPTPTHGFLVRPQAVKDLVQGLLAAIDKKL